LINELKSVNVLRKMGLLEKLCSIHAPSGEEVYMKEFLLEYINSSKKNWRVQPEIIIGNDIQDAIILKFGKPRTAIFAHMDTVGFTVGYNNKLIKIGSPRVLDNYILTGKDSKGFIETKIKIESTDKEEIIRADFEREIDRGTSLVFKSKYLESEDFIQSNYLDNRLGIYNALKTAETLENGIIGFTCWEEHGGGNVEVVAKYIYDNYKVRQALISDITWITDGINHGKGTAISMRDSGIPRRSFVNRIVEIAKSGGILYQLEVESAGGSDGNALQKTPYPFDWCFVGAPENNVHSPNETVHKNDARAMHDLYALLMEKL